MAAFWHPTRPPSSTTTIVPMAMLDQKPRDQVGHERGCGCRVESIAITAAALLGRITTARARTSASVPLVGWSRSGVEDAAFLLLELGLAENSLALQLAQLLELRQRVVHVGAGLGLRLRRRLFAVLLLIVAGPS